MRLRTNLFILFILTTIVMPNLTFAGSLHVAAEKGLVERAKKLIASGQDINDKDDTGRTPLHWAVQEGHTSVVNFLIASGCMVDPKNDNGDTPLLLSSYVGHADIVKVLLEHGADVDVKDSEGATPLALAILQRHYPVAEVLVNSGSNVNTTIDRFDNTLLHKAAMDGELELVRLLIAKGARIGAENNSGTKPLLDAAHNGQTAVAKFLIKNGANIETRDNLFGITPLYAAALNGHLEMVRLLISEGANVNTRSRSVEIGQPSARLKTPGRSALQAAEAGDHQETINLLRQHGAKE